MSVAGCRVERGETPEERHFSYEGGRFGGFHPSNSNESLVADAIKAAVKLIGTPYVEEYYENDSYYSPGEKRRVELRWGPRYRLTEAGRALALGPEPEFRYPAPPVIGEAEVELLRNLAHQPEHYKTPYHCGGTNGSRTSVSLYKLVLNGYAEMLHHSLTPVTGMAAYPKPRLFRRGKGSRRFRITQAGLKHLATLKG